MPVLKNQLTQELESLRKKTSSDFTALACTSKHEPHLRWRYVAGNRSERYKQMLVKPGLGPGGLTLRTGKPVLWTKLHASPPNLQMECPLIASEQLLAAAAVPIMNGESVNGVLLIARRSSVAYDDSGLGVLQQYVRLIKMLLEPVE